MARFLFHSGAGLLVLSVVGCALVAVLVWSIVYAAVALIAWASWRLYEAARARLGHPYSPGGKA